MLGEGIFPQTTLAVIIGASEWPKSPLLGSGKSFANSARDIREYLLDKEKGFGLPDENLLYLFDSDRSPTDHDTDVSLFLETHKATAKDLIIFYIGHGGFFGQNRKYYLAIRSTRKNAEGNSSYRMVDLAKTLNENAKHLRRYLILDSCFSASAYEEFQSAPLQVVREKTFENLPKKGTALLCSTGPRDPSIAPENEKYTMFSGGFLDVLNKGDPKSNTAFSLEEIGHKIKEVLREKYLNEAVMPEVHSPSQREGDIADIPLFPNVALRSHGLASRLNMVELNLVQVELKLQEFLKRFTNFENEIKLLQTNLKSIDLSQPGKSYTGSMKPGLADEPGTYDHFYISEAIWKKIPQKIRDDLITWRKAQQNGFVWLFISFGICCPFLIFTFYIQYFFKSDTVPYGISLTQGYLRIFTYLGFIIGTLTLLYSISNFKRFFAKESNVPFPPDSLYEELDPIIEMRATKIYYFLGLPIASPKFEFGLAIYALAMIVYVIKRYEMYLI